MGVCKIIGALGNVCCGISDVSATNDGLPKVAFVKVVETLLVSGITLVVEVCKTSNCLILLCKTTNGLEVYEQEFPGRTCDTFLSPHTDFVPPEVESTMTFGS